MCIVTALAISKSTILIINISTTNNTDAIIVIHNNDKDDSFVLFEIDL